MKRTHNCGEIRATDNNQEVILSGWIKSRRDFGGFIFLDLRDRSGFVQVCLDPATGDELMNVGSGLREEWVITVYGKVNCRPEDMINKNIPTGEVEILASKVEIENKSKPMPFNLDDDKVN